MVVVEAVAPVWLWRWVTRLGVRPILVRRWDSLMWEFWSVHLLRGRGASVVAQGDALEGYLGGRGRPRSFPSACTPQTPKPMKAKSSTCIHDCPKDSVILASAMTQSGVLGKEMKVYVDKENM